MSFFSRSPSRASEDDGRGGAAVLVTGARGGIGKPMCAGLASRFGQEVIAYGRQQCDLEKEAPPLPASASLKAVVHLATNFKDPKRDTVMLRRILDWSAQRKVPYFVYFSSWVVHFPSNCIVTGYVRAKRASEALVREAREKYPDTKFYIVRPSVVVGDDGLMWQRLITKLKPYANVLPAQLSRSFVDVGELVEVVADIVGGKDGPCKLPLTVTMLGQRAPLKDWVREDAEKGSNFSTQQAFAHYLDERRGASLFWNVVRGSTLIVLVALCAFGYAVAAASALCAIVIALLLILAAVHCVDYFSGLTNFDFRPTEEEDILALAHSYNQGKVTLHGALNVRTFFSSNETLKGTQYFNQVALKDFNRVLRIDPAKGVVVAQSGATFHQLLPVIRREGCFLENYPNYFGISLGACIATAVHGSTCRLPFIGCLIQGFRCFNCRTNEMEEYGRDEPDSDFRNLLFDKDWINGRLVLEVTLRIKPTTVRYAIESTQLTVDKVGDPIALFGAVDGSAGGGSKAEAEAKVESKAGAVGDGAEDAELGGDSGIGTVDSIELRKNYASTNRATLNVYSRQAVGRKIKADYIGNMWNLMEPLGIVWTARLVAYASWNFEWFLKPEQFRDFWKEVFVDTAHGYYFFKCLVRKNPMVAGFEGNKFFNTISIDISALKTPGNRRRVIDLYNKYRPMYHTGKDYEFFAEPRLSPSLSNSFLQDMDLPESPAHGSGAV